MVDFNLSPGNPVVADDVALVLQQIDILFDTYNGEVISDINFGTDYERCLYDLQLSNAGLEEKVNSDLSKLDLRGFQREVHVYLLQGSEQDIALIDIILKRNNEKYNKTYKIS